MATKVKELNPFHQGDRAACPICNPTKSRIREDKVWTWATKHGESPWRDKS